MTGRSHIADELHRLLQTYSAGLDRDDLKSAEELIAELGRIVGESAPARNRPAFASPPDDAALRTYLGDLPQTPYDGSAAFAVPPDRIMPRHADILTREFPSLWSLVGDKQRAHRELRICIITPDIAGPTRSGGVGTAYRCAAEFLRDCGHRVTVLYTRGSYCENGTIQDWVDRFERSAIRLVPLPESVVPPTPSRMGRALAEPRGVYEWLKLQSFDLVHVTEWKGTGYVALSAKRLGLAFQNTLFLVKASSPTLWGLKGGGIPVRKLDALLTTFMERKSIEYADVVISPSRHMLRWMMRHGYDLPKKRCFVHPNIIRSTTDVTPDSPLLRTPISEIVFFGRLTARKGILIFLKALSLLGPKLSGIKVTFLGKTSVTFDFHKALKESSPSFAYEILEDKNSDEAVAYLRGAGRMAIIPSLLDNSPFTVFECLVERIPFLTSDRGGGPELIREEDRPAVVFDPVPSELAARIAEVLREGAVVPRPAFDTTRNLEAWREAHLAFAEPAAMERFGGQAAHQSWNGAPPVVRAPGDLPLVSVCIAHFNRPVELSQAIASLDEQTYPNLEIVVVDDGSSRRDALVYLETLRSELAASGRGKLIRQPNRYLGAVRNTGIRNSQGRFILLMDDDNIAKPHEIETFMAAADFSGADILSCYSDTFAGSARPKEGRDERHRMTPLGDSVSLGLFANCFGDSNCFVRREVFDALGGFTEDYGVGRDDNEFFARAVLRGFKLRVVPEALYWYRNSEVRLRNSHFGDVAADVRVLNAYLDNVPACIHEALLLAQGQFRPPATSRHPLARLRRWAQALSRAGSR